MQRPAVLAVEPAKDGQPMPKRVVGALERCVGVTCVTAGPSNGVRAAFAAGVSVDEALKRAQRATSQGAAMPRNAVKITEAPLDALLFVGNLGDMTDECLRGLCEPFGPLVRCFSVRDASGASKGYGFVECVSPEAAANMKASLAAREVHGRGLRVDWAPTCDTPESMHSRTLFIDRIPRNFVDENALVALCTDPADSASLEFCKVAVSTGRSNAGKCRGFALADYREPAATEVAWRRINGATLGGAVLRASYANPAKLGSQIFAGKRTDSRGPSPANVLPHPDTLANAPPCKGLVRAPTCPNLGRAPMSESTEVPTTTTTATATAQQLPMPQPLPAFRRAPSSPAVLRRAPSSPAGLLPAPPSPVGCHQRAPSSPSMMQRRESSSGLIPAPPSPISHGMGLLKAPSSPSALRRAPSSPGMLMRGQSSPSGLGRAPRSPAATRLAFEHVPLPAPPPMLRSDIMPPPAVSTMRPPPGLARSQSHPHFAFERTVSRPKISTAALAAAQAACAATAEEAAAVAAATASANVVAPLSPAALRRSSSSKALNPPSSTTLVAPIVSHPYAPHPLQHLQGHQHQQIHQSHHRHQVQNQNQNHGQEHPQQQPMTWRGGPPRGAFLPRNDAQSSIDVVVPTMKSSVPTLFARAQWANCVPSGEICLERKRAYGTKQHSQGLAPILIGESSPKREASSPPKRTMMASAFSACGPSPPKRIRMH